MTRHRIAIALCDVTLALGPYLIVIGIPLAASFYEYGGPRCVGEWLWLSVGVAIAATWVFLFERRERRRRRLLVAFEAFLHDPQRSPAAICHVNDLSDPERWLRDHVYGPDRGDGGES